MRFEILTIFPNFFASFFENGILRRALAEGLVEVGVHDLREFTHDRHRTVDDRPFGGGEGMVLKPQPIADALASLGIEPKATDASNAYNSSALYQGTTSVVPNSDPKIDLALAPAETRPTVIILSAQGRPSHPIPRPSNSRPRPRSLSSAAATKAWTNASTSSFATWSYP